MKKSKRVFSALILISFLIEHTSFAAELKPEAVNVFQSQKYELGFKFPDSIATTEDSWKAPDSKKTIYLLQDAHTNESGQINLAKTLDILLDKEKDLKYIFVEAGAGDDSLSFLRKYSSLANRKEVASEYLKKGLLHGEEYLDLTCDHDFVIWGVEDMALYQKAIDAYRAVVKDREKFQRYLSKIQVAVDTLKPRVFNPGLLLFDEKQTKYFKEEIPLTDYFQFLTREADKRNISLFYFPHFKSLNNLKDKESRIDFKIANEEQQKVIQSLSTEDQKELLEYAKEESPFKLGSQDRREDKAFYALLEEKTKRAASSCPELTKYFNYLREAKDLDPKRILEEQKQLEMEIFSVLAKTADEQVLARCQKNLRFLQKLFDLKLTPEEYAEYKSDSEGFTIGHLTGFLNKKIMDLKNFYERAVFLEEGYASIVKNSETFYELTQDRDAAFLKALSEKMDKENSAKAILITGGFHTRNLKTLFRKQNISFVSITPQVYQETNQKKYEMLLLDQRIVPSQGAFATPHIQSMARTLSLMQLPSMFSLVSSKLGFPPGEKPLVPKKGAREAGSSRKLKPAFATVMALAMMSLFAPGQSLAASAGAQSQDFFLSLESGGNIPSDGHGWSLHPSGRSLNIQGPTEARPATTPASGEATVIHSEPTVSIEAKGSQGSSRGDARQPIMFMNPGDLPLKSLTVFNTPAGNVPGRGDTQVSLRGGFTASRFRDADPISGVNPFRGGGAVISMSTLDGEVTAEQGFLESKDFLNGFDLKLSGYGTAGLTLYVPEPEFMQSIVRTVESLTGGVLPERQKDSPYYLPTGELQIYETIATSRGRTFYDTVVRRYPGDMDGHITLGLRGELSSKKTTVIVDVAVRPDFLATADDVIPGNLYSVRIAGRQAITEKFWVQGWYGMTFADGAGRDTDRFGMRGRTDSYGLEIGYDFTKRFGVSAGYIERESPFKFRPLDTSSTYFGIAFRVKFGFGTVQIEGADGGSPTSLFKYGYPLDNNWRKAQHDYSLGGTILLKSGGSRSDKKSLYGPPDGARLATQDEQALTVFALNLARIHSEADLKEPIALSLDIDKPSFFRIVKEGGEDGIKRVDLKVLTADGTYQTLVAIPDPSSALVQIQKLSTDEYSGANAGAIRILLAIAAQQTDSTIDTQNVSAPLEHALPMGSLASIEDENVFKAQAQILAEALLRIQKLPEFRKDVFYLTGEFDEVQKAVLDTLIGENELASKVRVGEPKHESAAVRYVDTARITSTPTPNAGEIQFPVTGLEKDRVLGWYSVIREAASVGRTYAAHFNGQAILFDEVTADALPEQAFSFHNTHAVKPLPDRLRWKNVLEGRVALDEFKDASFYLPLERIAIDLLVQGARMALQATGGSA